MADRRDIRSKIEENLREAKSGVLEKTEAAVILGPAPGGRIKNSIMKALVKLKNIPIVGNAAQWFFWMLKAPRAVKHLLIDLDDLTAVSRKNESSLRADVDELRAKLQLARTAIAANADILAELAKGPRSERADGAVKDRSSALAVQAADDFYFEFENRFRGKREDIKERQKQYLPNVLSLGGKPGGLKVIDLGSGRGEWLELLKENNISASGIDLNARMVQECVKLGLDVRAGDAIGFLRESAAESAHVISAFHLVEHLGAGNLVAMFREAVRVLKPGGLVIFETPNPESLLVMSPNFYLDLSHQTPIPPLTLEFLAASVGFEEIEIKRVSPVQFVEIAENDKLQNILEKFNMAQEYALIAAKPR